jgi:hypothetical protein
MRIRKEVKEAVQKGGQVCAFTSGEVAFIQNAARFYLRDLQAMLGGDEDNKTLVSLVEIQRTDYNSVMRKVEAAPFQPMELVQEPEGDD